MLVLFHKKKKKMTRKESDLLGTASCHVKANCIMFASKQNKTKQKRNEKERKTRKTPPTPDSQLTSLRVLWAASLPPLSRCPSLCPCPHSPQSGGARWPPVCSRHTVRGPHLVTQRLRLRRLRKGGFASLQLSHTFPDTGDESKLPPASL